MSLTFLHTSDFHGHLSSETAGLLAELRQRHDALYFDCGDLIQAGNLAWPTKEDKGWSRLREIGLTACTLGNRETHPVEAAFAAKLKGLPTALVANLRRKGEAAPPLIGGTQIADSRIFEHQGLRIGVFGVMVPMVTARMKTQIASAFLWDDPITTALRVAEDLRPQVDLVIALTHIGQGQDRRLLEMGPPIDILLGGHSHTVLEEPERIGRTWMSHTGSHGRFAGLYEWSEGLLAGRLHPLR